MGFSRHDPHAGKVREPGIPKSRLIWSDVESAVRNADGLMRGDNVGDKMIAISRLQGLLEDLVSAVQREDEKP
jgi:hypothetical protein